MGFDPKKYMEMLRRNPQLSKEEYEFLRERLTMSKEIGISTGRSVTIHRGTEVSEGVGMQGATPNIGVITNLDAEEGRFISETENDRHMNVAFIGHDLKDKFFPGQNAIADAECRRRRSRLWACRRRRARCSGSRRITSL